MPQQTPAKTITEKRTEPRVWTPNGVQPRSEPETAPRSVRWAVPLMAVGIVMILITLPYWQAWQASGSDFVFGGILINPADGNSYLAKMVQGWEGAWRTQLPYTAEPGSGAYLFLFYLALGHLARITGLSLLVTYHLARLVGAAVLFLALHHFYLAVLPPRWRLAAFLLALFGSGMGWVALFLGGFTSDFWVAEAYPFLGAYTNPHFPLGMALMLWLLTPAEASRSMWPLALAALALSIISPFGVVVAGVVWAGMVVWDWAARRDAREALSRLFWIGLGGGPMLLYAQWVAVTDPVWAGWNAQNLTPSPPIWDLLLSFSPVLLLALTGGWQVWRAVRLEAQGEGEAVPGSMRLLLVWAALGLALLYLPFGLQRRFMMGLFIPLAGLAPLGLAWLADRTRLSFRFWSLAAVLLFLPTLLLLLLAAQHGVQTHDEQIYLSQDEAAALEWVRQNTDPEALILAAPDTGLFIPAHTGRRVIYGHPFETVRAVAEREAVEQVLQTPPGAAAEARQFLEQRQVDYIFFGPREGTFGELPAILGAEPVFASGRVAVYPVQP